MSHDEFEIHRLAGRDGNADAFQPELDERIGRRLRRESRALAARYPGRPNVAALANAAQSGTTTGAGAKPGAAGWALRPRVAASLLVVAGLLVLAAVGVLVRSSHDRAPVERELVKTAGWRGLSKAKAPKHHATGPSLRSDPATLPPTAAADGPQDMLTLVVTVPDGQGGRKVIGTATVPLKVEPFSLDRLSPAERYAVERALADEDGLQVASEI